MDLGLFRAGIESEFGPECLVRVDPRIQAIVERSVTSLWSDLPPWVGDVDMPGVLAVHTGELFPHVRTRGTRSVIVFDDSLRILCRSLTRAVVNGVGAEPRALVAAIFAQRLIHHGFLVESAAVAQLIAAERGTATPPTMGADDDHSLLDRLVQGQIVFIAAHEAFHAVLRTSEAAQLLRHVVSYDIALYLSGPLVQPQPPGIVAAHVWEILTVIDVLGAAPSLYGNRDEKVQSVVDALDDPVLREELVCDLYGAIATHKLLTRSGTSERIAVAASVMALVNLTGLRYLERHAASEPARATRILRDLSIRLEALIGALIVRATEGAIERGKNANEIVALLLENVAMALRWYSPLNHAMMRHDWSTVPDRWLGESEARRAAAVRLSSDLASLRATFAWATDGG
jgi:hypothetical protein